LRNLNKRCFLTTCTPSRTFVARRKHALDEKNIYAFHWVLAARNKCQRNGASYILLNWHLVHSARILDCICLFMTQPFYLDYLLPGRYVFIIGLPKRSFVFKKSIKLL
jgi:hypothetical protein